MDSDWASRFCWWQHGQHQQQTVFCFPSSDNANEWVIENMLSTFSITQHFFYYSLDSWSYFFSPKRCVIFRAFFCSCFWKTLQMQTVEIFRITSPLWKWRTSKIISIATGSSLTWSCGYGDNTWSCGYGDKHRIKIISQDQDYLHSHRIKLFLHQLLENLQTSLTHQQMFSAWWGAVVGIKHLAVFLLNGMTALARPFIGTVGVGWMTGESGSLNMLQYITLILLVTVGSTNFSVMLP